MFPSEVRRKYDLWQHIFSSLQSRGAQGHRRCSARTLGEGPCRPPGRSPRDAARMTSRPCHRSTHNQCKRATDPRVSRSARLLGRDVLIPPPAGPPHGYGLPRGRDETTSSAEPTGPAIGYCSFPSWLPLIPAQILLDPERRLKRWQGQAMVAAVMPSYVAWLPSGLLPALHRLRPSGCSSSGSASSGTW